MAAEYVLSKKVTFPLALWLKLNVKDKLKSSLSRSKMSVKSQVKSNLEFILMLQTHKIDFPILLC